MKTARRILLYGNSVILGTIGISLSRYSQFEVTKIAPSLQEKQKVGAAKADILLFDLEAPHTEKFFSLLKTNPTLHLIGVNPGINLVKVWSGRQLQELSMQGLLDLIKGAAND